MFLGFIVSCSKNYVEKNDSASSNAQMQAKIEAAFGTNNAKRIEMAKKIFLSPNSTAEIREIVVKSKGTGKNSFAYIISDDKYIQNNNVSSMAQPCGSMEGGWILHNDGCFYHGTLVTGCDGSTLFIEDPSPYTDGYIGNEPKCGYGDIA